MDIKELTLKIFRKYHNLQIPELPEIITNYLINKPEDTEMYLDKRIDIDELLEFIARDYASLTRSYTVKSELDESLSKQEIYAKTILDFTLRYFIDKRIFR